MIRRAQPRRSTTAAARTGGRALAAVLVLAMSGCATIPEHSEPRGVRWVDEGNSTEDVQEPRRDMDPLPLVRSFVDSAAAPENEHEAARLHLTAQARSDWSPSAGMRIVDQVDTIPVQSDQPLPRGVQLVGLRAEKVGRLLPDRSFVPEQGEFNTRVRVERQDDGQWRIATPLPELIATRDSFSSTYRSVSVYFPDSESSGVVPDVRYVPSQPASTLPSRVIDLLMMGPSESMRAALRTGLPEGVRPKTNASESADGALVVNFSDLGDVSQETRRLIAAQVAVLWGRLRRGRSRHRWRVQLTLARLGLGNWRNHPHAQSEQDGAIFRAVTRHKLPSSDLCSRWPATRPWVSATRLDR